MKKHLLLSILLLSSFLVYAGGKINVDKMKDGYRFIQTERTPHVFMHKETMTDGAVSLDFWNYDGLENYSLVIYLFFEKNIEEGAKLLLKLDNDEVIELESSSPLNTIRNVVVFPVVQTITFINYPISKEQLNKVIVNNVVKIRVETPIGHFDGKVYGKKFTQAIEKDYKAIQKTREKETSIYDNF